MIKNCLYCNKEFKTIPCEIKRGNGKFCSQSCSTSYRNNISKTLNIHFPSAIYRFYFNISKDKHPNGCWIWTKNKNSQGYGKFSVNMKTVMAHRFSWELYYGKIESHILVCHKCDNPSCVNPEHLFLGNHKDNSQDRSKKGRNRNQNGSRHNFAKLLEYQVLEIRKRLSNGEKGKNLAQEFNISEMSISDIKLRKKWKHI